MSLRFESVSLRNFGPYRSIDELDLATNAESPIVVIHGNQTADIPNHYTKYLEKTFRRVMDLHGTPIRIEYRTTDNPYAEKKKKVTQREFIKKRRLENAHPNKK